MKYEEARAIIRSPFNYSKESQTQAAKIVLNNIFAQEEDMDLAFQLTENKYGALKKIFRRFNF